MQQDFAHTTSHGPEPPLPRGGRYHRRKGEATEILRSNVSRGLRKASFPILSTGEDTENFYSFIKNNKCNGNSSLETDYAKSRSHVISRCAVFSRKIKTSNVVFQSV